MKKDGPTNGKLRTLPRITIDPSVPVVHIARAAASIGCKLVATPDGLHVTPRN